jgi:outer membrane protein OmpA-like peptidoglycan-associated protein
MILGALLSALLAPWAFGQEPVVQRSVDTQLLHPVPSAQAAFGVDSPRADTAQRLALGLAWQLEQQPLRYTLQDGGVGSAVLERQTLHLGASYAAGERTTVYLRASGALMAPGDLALVAPARGAALGDLALGVKGSWLERGPLALGPAVALWIPVGSADSWVAESSVRYAPSLLAALGGERVELLANLGMLARVQVDTGADFVASPEITGGAALRLSATPWLAGLVELSSRHGLGDFLQGGAENPVSLQGGLRLSSLRWGRVDLLAGTGLTQGYGTPELRLGLAVLAHRPSRQVDPEPPPVVVAPPPPTPVLAAPPPAPLVEAPRRVWIEHGRILLDAPIAFEPGSAVLEEPSEALLGEVAALVNDYPQIELLVIEGHADEAGRAGEDFELSLERSRVVFERLVASAVRPARLSYRGMGHASPGGPGGPRGVDLLITRVRPLQDGLPPEDPSEILLPWSGEAVAAPSLGSKRLGADAHPILEREPVPSLDPGDQLPTGESFRQALDDDTDPPEAP